MGSFVLKLGVGLEAALVPPAGPQERELQIGTVKEPHTDLNPKKGLCKNKIGQWDQMQGCPGQPRTCGTLVGGCLKPFELL